jgi:hypothetical protein
MTVARMVIYLDPEDQRLASASTDGTSALLRAAWERPFDEGSGRDHGQPPEAPSWTGGLGAITSVDYRARRRRHAAATGAMDTARDGSSTGVHAKPATPVQPFGRLLTDARRVRAGSAEWGSRE